MNTYPTMPSADQLREDVLGVCFRPTRRRDDVEDHGTVTPDVVAYGCDVVLNLVGVIPRIQAGAVYLMPERHRVRHVEPPRLIAVVASPRRVGTRLVVDWVEAVVGEIVGERNTQP